MPITPEQVHAFKRAMATQEAIRGYPPAEPELLEAVYAVLDEQVDDTVSNEPEQPPDEFHYQEALHMASVFAQTVDMFLREHCVVRAHPEIQAMVDMAVDKLNDAYQEIGRVRFTLSKE